MNKTELRIIAMEYAVTLCKTGEAFVWDNLLNKIDVVQVAQDIFDFLSSDEEPEE